LGRLTKLGNKKESTTGNYHVTGISSSGCHMLTNK